MTTCKQCQAEIDELDVFPGHICLECYAKTEDARRPRTAQEIVEMWGGK